MHVIGLETLINSFYLIDCVHIINIVVKRDFTFLENYDYCDAVCYFSAFE